MFAPTKTWRRWHRKINIGQRRFAVCSALAASAVPALVMARGHRIDNVPEVPLVVSNESVKDLKKTKQAVALLKTLNAYDDVEKAKESRQVRAGKGKMRNRRYVQRRGPLVIYSKKGPLVYALRNVPGIELCPVKSLNLLQLAPGGHLGRFCIWVKDAFQRLDALYGTFKKPATAKKHFRLPRPVMTNPDLARILTSDEVQSHLRPVIHKKPHLRKKNPLKNIKLMAQLNPHVVSKRRNQILQEQRRTEKKNEIVAAKRAQRKQGKVIKKRRAEYYKALLANPRIYEGAKKDKAAPAQAAEAADKKDKEVDDDGDE